MSLNKKYRSPNRRVILLAVPELYGPGGVQLACRLIAQSLTSLTERWGCELRILALNDRLDAGADPPIQAFARRKARFALRAVQLMPRSEVFIAAHPNLAPIGWVAKRLFRRRLVVMTWGIDAWGQMTYLRRMSLRAADTVVAPTSFTARRVIEDQGVSSENVVLLPLPVAPAFSQEAARSLAAPKTDGKLTILSVGRMDLHDRNKGFDQILDVIPEFVRTHPICRFIFVGEGDDRLRLQARCRELGIEPAVSFTGNVSMEELHELYRSCDIFCLPSTKEGFGFVYLEAMAFGKPVIAARAGGPTDLIEDGVEGFLIDAAVLDELASRMLQLIESPQLRLEMGRSGKKRVLEQHTFEEFHSRLAGVLALLLSDATQGPVA